MKALVLGVGRMGTAIAYGMQKLGASHIIGMDTNVKAGSNMPNSLDKERIDFFAVDGVEDIFSGIVALGSPPDIVISSLPYHQTEEVGTWCVDNGIRYCDLGGRVDVSANINEWATKKATKPVFTDLGLAPGWVNIVAEQGCKEIHKPIEDVKMMVGGLPAVQINPPLNYAVTWSVDGLINEYRDDCKVLMNGEVKTVSGMDGKQKVDFELMGDTELEAFFTSGGASHTIDIMKKRGVKNCSYKTIRYKGHCDSIRFLFDNAQLDDETLKKIFEVGCPDATGDIVLLKVEVSSGNLTWKKESVVGYDHTFSAMQKATAFSICSVAALMAEGIFDERKMQNRGGDVKLPVVLNYSDVPFDRFNKNLEKLGIK